MPMFVVFIQVPCTLEQLRDPEWRSEPFWQSKMLALSEVTGEEIKDTARGMFSCDASGESLSRDFWFDVHDFEKVAEIRQFCNDSGFGFRVREKRTPDVPMCPVCGEKLPTGDEPHTTPPNDRKCGACGIVLPESCWS